MIPLTPLFLFFLVLLVLGYGLDLLLTFLNVKNLNKLGHCVPEQLKSDINSEILVKMSSYTSDNQKFHLVKSSLDSAVLIAALLTGIIPWLAGRLETMGYGYLVSGLLFFSTIGLMEGFLHLPFSYFHSFVIEQRYGFNTATLRIWLSDLLKSMIIGVILGGILLSSALLLLHYGGRFWWIWVWLVFLLFQIVMVIIYPVLIAPLFNKFSPLENQDLKQGIENLLEKSGLSAAAIYVMDAGKRNRHSNAYFTGFGKAKRIVLFDTLLDSHSSEEVLAVLAHEIGHWKKKHILKNVFLAGIFSFVLLYTAGKILAWPAFYHAFGFERELAYAGLFLIGVIWEPISRFLSPLGSAVSRFFEREADTFAVKKLHQGPALITALRRLGKDNLTNLYPHPAYVWFYYSHPPLLKRIEFLTRLQEQS